MSACLLENDFEGLRIVSSGQDAHEAYAARDFDNILMNVQMPVMTGLEAMRSILDAKCASAPVPQLAAITENGSKADIAKLPATGLDVVLTKTVSRSGHYLFKTALLSSLKDLGA